MAELTLEMIKRPFKEAFEKESKLRVENPKRGFQDEDVCPWCKLEYLQFHRGVLWCRCCDIEVERGEID